MKFQPDAISGPSIHGYGAGWINVNGEKVTTSVVIDSQGGYTPWGASGYDGLDGAHFERLAALAPELVIFGSGERIRFPNPRWLSPLYARRIGVETMDTQAACRTFNFLVGEGRRVVAALLL